MELLAMAVLYVVSWLVIIAVGVLFHRWCPNLPTILASLLFGAVVGAILIPFSIYVVDMITPSRTEYHQLPQNSSFGELVAIGAGMGAVWGLVALMRSNTHQSSDDDYDYDYDDFW